ncbi:MAG: aldehyde ferredoxin oxidoreductase family protein [Deltaproteobacteria bacterium]|nr:aldehyde ferredoxin oxidoreductase family protein [Deltaproteobacteria bacterium]
MERSYNGKILHVNLTTGDITVETPDEKFYRKYIGGSAMGGYYLLKQMPAGVDALGPDNVVAMMASVITGVAISGQSRLTVSAKSPLTGCIGDSQCGGYFPAKLKSAGFDGIVITGKSEEPVYLSVNAGQAELRSATHLWGKTTEVVENTLREELGDKKLELMQVGPSGEIGVLFSALLTRSSHASGRTGMGAVFGAKNLKAVVVQGTEKPGIADKASFKAIAQWGVKNFPESDIVTMGTNGTAETIGANNEWGGLPTYNFNSGVYEDAEIIDGPAMTEKYLKGAAEGNQNREGRGTCYSCTVRCKRVVEVKEGPFKVDPTFGGPEYETVATFGSYCGINDLAAISKANEICNRYGIDTISCGATIAWAMEAFEEGKLTTDDTEGIELKFGNATAMVEMVSLIAKKEGFGKILAEGSARAAQKIGRGTEAFLICCKKQEAPAHMPQVKPSLSVIYAINPYGADHQSSEHDPGYEAYPEFMGQIGLNNPQEEHALNEEIVRFGMRTQHVYSFMDTINVCQFVFGPAWQLYNMDQLLKVVQSVTGWDMTMDELIQIGERRLNLQRAFNAREGIGRNEDKLPEKMFKKGLKGGLSDGFKVDRDLWKTSMDQYYKLAGWDGETGYPSQAKLDELGIGWASEGF